MINIGIKLFDGSLYPVGDVTSMQGAEVVITTIADNQRIAEVELYLLTENKSIHAPFIGKFTIRDIPEAKAGEPRYTLIIKADSANNLNVLVYDRGKLSGKMDIPVTGWHPEHKTETISHVVMNKSDDATFKRDFEVHYKSEKDNTPPKKVEKEEKQHLPAIPKEEKIHTIPPQTVVQKPPTITPVAPVMTTIASQNSAKFTPPLQSEEKKSPVRAVLLAVAAVALLGLIVFLAMVRPWSTPGGISSAETIETGNGPLTDTASLEEPATPEPTEDAAAVFNALNDKIRGLGNIYFEPDTTVLHPGSTEKLDMLAALLGEMKGKLKLAVTGHTAKWGTQEEQYELSVKRAELIIDEMVKRSAIDKKDTSARGVGATIPATTNEERIDLNRRVEIVTSPLEPAQ